MSTVLPIQPDNRWRRYTASAGQVTFPVVFPFQQNEDVELLLLADGFYSTLPRSSYTLSGAGNPTGGSATFIAGRPAGDIIAVVGKAILDRLSSVVRDGRFSSKLIDDEFDRNRIIQQEQQRDIDRSLKLDFGVSFGFIQTPQEGSSLVWHKVGSFWQIVNGPDAYGEVSRLNQEILDRTSSDDRIETESKQRDAALASVIGQSGPIEVPVYDTRLAVTFAFIKGTVNAIRTSGHTVPGDLGNALYKRVATEPSHAGKVRSSDRFLPSGVSDIANGGWWELAEKTVNPIMFGAVWDGVSDDTQPIRDAIEYSPDVFLPRGKTRVTDLIEIPCGTSFQGYGLTMTEIVIDCPSFLLISDGPNYARSVIGGFSVLATRAPATNSFGIKHDASNYSPLRNSISLNNILFRGNDGIIQSSMGFGKYIWTINTYGGEARYIRIEGGYLATQNPVGQFASIGAHISGQSVAFLLDHCNFNAVHRGVLSDGITEGTQCAFCEMVGVRIGFDFTPSEMKPGVWLTSCHANATSRGIVCNNRADIHIVNSAFYRTNFFFEEAWAGIEISGASLNTEIAACSCVDSNTVKTTTSRGILLVGAIGVDIAGFSSRGTTRGIETASGVNGLTATNLTLHNLTEGIRITIDDSNIWIGAHVFAGSVTTRYVVPTALQSVRIEGRDLRYNRVGSVTAIAAAATIVFTKGAQAQLVPLTFAAGAGAYTCYLDLSTDGAYIGDYIKFVLTMPASTNPTVIIRNGSGGSSLATVNTSTAGNYSAEAVFNGTGWILTQLHRMTA